MESAGGQFAVLVTTSRSLVGDAGEKTYQMLYAMLDDLKIDYLKLQPVFTTDDLLSLQYKRDQHWTPKGHEVVAAQLADFLPPLMQTGVRDSD